MTIDKSLVILVVERDDVVVGAVDGRLVGLMVERYDRVGNAKLVPRVDEKAIRLVVKDDDCMVGLAVVVDDTVICVAVFEVENAFAVQVEGKFDVTVVGCIVEEVNEKFAINEVEGVLVVASVVVVVIFEVVVVIIVVVVVVVIVVVAEMYREILHDW